MSSFAAIALRLGPRVGRQPRGVGGHHPRLQARAQDAREAGAPGARRGRRGRRSLRGDEPLDERVDGDVARRADQDALPSRHQRADQRHERGRLPGPGGAVDQGEVAGAEGEGDGAALRGVEVAREAAEEGEVLLLLLLLSCGLLLLVRCRLSLCRLLPLSSSSSSVITSSKFPLFLLQPFTAASAPANRGLLLPVVPKHQVEQGEARQSRRTDPNLPRASSSSSRRRQRRHRRREPPVRDVVRQPVRPQARARRGRGRQLVPGGSSTSKSDRLVAEARDDARCEGRVGGGGPGEAELDQVCEAEAVGGEGMAAS